MFEPSSKPRVYGLPPGVDFAREVIEGLRARVGVQAPEALASVEIITNTRRLQRRLRDILDQGPACLHPRIRVLGDLAHDPVPGLALPVPPLRRRLELMRLVRQLIDAAPDIAPKAAAFDLADSLAALFEEMHGEGVDPASLRNMEVPDVSGHWQRALQFVDLVAGYFEQGAEGPDTEGRLRAVALRLTEKWAETPPLHPVLVVGSTGSRGATSVLMEAVARLPQGALILPGFDTDLPENVWNAMDDPALSEDHPQYRFRQIMARLDLSSSDIGLWTEAGPPSPERNALVSLSLRPAPVTDQWLREAPRLQNVAQACAGITLVTAETRREEADTIALRLRAAIEEGRTAALISPDRLLTRQVAAALDRWDIKPDDSAGVPLSLSPPGRLFLHVLDAMQDPLRAEALMTLLKHPLSATGTGDRGAHLLNTRELELWIRGTGVPFPVPDDLIRWRRTGKKDRAPWSEWVDSLMESLRVETGPVSVSQRLKQLVEIAENLSRGPGGEGAGGLWKEAAGRTARALFDDMARHAEAAGELGHTDFAALIRRLLAGGEVRDRDAGHPQVLIWGTLEARVQSADLVILGSMNDGSWPELPSADPWLNRQLRAAVGLLLPERRVGLSAHDYQLAMAAREVWITRAARSDDAQTVPSRWINRLTNLLGGLADTLPLEEMEERGAGWLARARALSRPVTEVAREPRPSPRPPVDARPRRYSVTQIETLTRDPFEIYAKKVLRLYPLHPLQREADAMLRGIVVHSIMERFGNNRVDPDTARSAADLLKITDTVLADHCPWPTARALWRGRIERVTDWFLETEKARQRLARPEYFEAEVEIAAPGTGVMLTGRADRVDVTEAGTAYLYDYKTGRPPSANEQVAFNPQLLLLAAICEKGGFKGRPAMPVAGASYIGLGSSPGEVKAPLGKHPPEQVWAEVVGLLQAWRDPDRGFTARIANKEDREDRDYDHLSRLGEWDVTDQPVAVVLK